MRKEFCRAMTTIAQTDPAAVFLTGDLGFMALEPLRDMMGRRFVNAGVAEQNMVSMAAALAREGLHPWTYSIAPFLYARAFEQIRVDLAFHGAPVRLVGNGGGFGYGVQGSTHHALEDYGILLCLPHFKAFIPCAADDVDAILPRMHQRDEGPSYLRLGMDESAGTLGPYAPWRKVLDGRGGLAIGVGALAGAVAKRLAEADPQRRPEYWVCAELPISQTPPPAELLTALTSAQVVYTIEEHIRRSGFAAEFLVWLQERGLVKKTRSFAASSQMIGTYGDQNFMRSAAQIHPTDIVHELLSFRP